MAQISFRLTQWISFRMVVPFKVILIFDVVYSLHCIPFRMIVTYQVIHPIGNVVYSLKCIPFKALWMVVICKVIHTFKSSFFFSPQCVPFRMIVICIVIHTFESVVYSLKCIPFRI